MGGNRQKCMILRLTCKLGYLRKNHPLISVGETQKINWKKGDSVPIFIDIDERK